MPDCQVSIPSESSYIRQDAARRMKREIEVTIKADKQKLTAKIGNSIVMVGGPAQDLPKFQIPSLTQKSVQTCSIHSLDGDSKVSLKKNDLFMTNGAL